MLSRDIREQSPASGNNQEGGTKRSRVLNHFRGALESIGPVYCAAPRILLRRLPEHARINGDNLYILAEHVKCAAFELPFTRDETYGPLTQEDTLALLDHLVSHSVLHESQETTTG